MTSISNKPLSNDELAAYSDLIHDIAERADIALSLEGIDGFVTAAAGCAHAWSSPVNISRCYWANRAWACSR